MSGASVELIDAEKVCRCLDKLVRDATPLMRDIGEHVLNTTRDRFDSQTDPDGNPPLSDNTRRHKKRNADKILTLDGDLRGNLTCRARKRSRRDACPSAPFGGKWLHLRNAWQPGTLRRTWRRAFSRIPEMVVARQGLIDSRLALL